MLLLADSGATKTDWYIGNNPTDGLQFQTEGINPFHQSPSIICTILENNCSPISLFLRLPATGFSFTEPDVHRPKAWK